MDTSSPLRYPGGKSAMADLLGAIRNLNGLGNRAIAEPFAGGAGASLKLLFLEETTKIYINDADPAVHDFWWSVVHMHGPFLKMLLKKRVSIAEWRRQRDIYRTSRRVSRLCRGFATFYLNRCNRSGIIINGGPIGGIKQSGKWKINARFNKEELWARCEKVAEFGERISISCKDGIKFIRELDSKSTFFFIDPPYYAKGPLLYLNGLNASYHAALAIQLKAMDSAAWILTYDDCKEIRKLYKHWATIRPFSLRYTAASRRSGQELLITPKWMRLPRHQFSACIAW